MSVLYRKPLGEILVGLQVLTPEEVERVLEALRRRADRAKFGQVAREMGLVRDEHILAALAVQLEIFPGLGNMSLPGVLQRLQHPETEPPTGPASATPPGQTASRRLKHPRA